MARKTRQESRIERAAEDLLAELKSEHLSIYEELALLEMLRMKITVELMQELGKNNGDS